MYAGVLPCSAARLFKLRDGTRLIRPDPRQSFIISYPFLFTPSNKMKNGANVASCYYGRLKLPANSTVPRVDPSYPAPFSSDVRPLENVSSVSADSGYLDR